MITCSMVSLANSSLKLSDNISCCNICFWIPVFLAVGALSVWILVCWGRRFPFGLGIGREGIQDEGGEKPLRKVIRAKCFDNFTQAAGVMPGCGLSIGSFAKALGMRWWVLAFVCCCRVGEASHPGPEQACGSSWSIGLCNPSGLHSKISQVNQLQGEVWFICETHLSKYGVPKFRKSIQASKSQFKYFVHGAPCESRSSSLVGGYSGVGIISKLPLRALPHSL